MCPLVNSNFNKLTFRIIADNPCPQTYHLCRLNRNIETSNR